MTKQEKLNQNLKTLVSEVKKERQKLIEQENQFVQIYMPNLIKYMLTKTKEFSITLKGKKSSDERAVLKVYSTCRRVELKELINLATQIDCNFEDKYTFELYDNGAYRRITLYLNTDFYSCKDYIQKITDVFKSSEESLEIRALEYDSGYDVTLNLPY